MNSYRIRNDLVCLTDLKDEDPVHSYSNVFQYGNVFFTLLPLVHTDKAFSVAKHEDFKKALQTLGD